MLASLGGCGFLVKSGLPPPPPGTALQSFARDLGMAVEAAGAGDQASASSERFAGMSTDELTGFLAEGRAGLELLEKSYGGRPPRLDSLPPATDRISVLARARGLIFDLDRQPDAQALLNALLDAEARHVVALELLAESKLREGESGEAIRIFRELGAAFPKQPRFRLQLAHVLLAPRASASAASSKVGQASAAEATIRGEREGERILASLVTGPLGVIATEKLCGRLLRRFQTERAETILKEALRARPKHPGLEAIYGQTLRYAGRYEQALELLAPLAKLDGDDLKRVSSDSRYQIVWCLRGLGRYDEALGQLALYEERLRSDGTADTAFVRKLETALTQEKARGRRVSFALVELRSFVRKSPDPAQRENALEILMENASAVDGVEQDFLHVLRNDAKADLRARALVGLLRTPEFAAQAIEIALADPDAQNRLIGGGQATRLAPEKAVGLLFVALRREKAPNVFRALHERLAAVSQKSFFLGDGLAETEDGRSGVIRDWAERLGLSAQRPSGETGAQRGAQNNANGAGKSPQEKKN